MNLSVDKRGIINGMPPHLLKVHHGIVDFEFFGLCKFPTTLRVVGAGFARR